MNAKEGPGVTFTVVGDNLLAALHFLLSNAATMQTLRANEYKKLLTSVAEEAKAAEISIDGVGEKCKAALARKRKVVGSTSNKSESVSHTRPSRACDITKSRPNLTRCCLSVRRGLIRAIMCLVVHQWASLYPTTRIHKLDIVSCI